MDFDKKIFKNKTFAHVLEEIYTNSKDKEKNIAKLINDLVPYIKSPGDAVVMVPLLQEYISLSLKNDDQLIKMAAIVQRSMQEKNEDGEFALNEKDREDLFNLATKAATPVSAPMLIEKNNP